VADGFLFASGNAYRLGIQAHFSEIDAVIFDGTDLIQIHVAAPIHMVVAIVRQQAVQLLGSHSLFNVIISAVKNDKVMVPDLKEQNVCLHLEVLIYISGFQQAAHSCSPFYLINIDVSAFIIAYCFDFEKSYF
jgi:uncharacterized membrane protein